MGENLRPNRGRRVKELRGRLPFSSRCVFARILQLNPHACAAMVERLTGEHVEYVEVLETESEETSILNRSVCFDVYLENGESSFVVEMPAVEEASMEMRLRTYRYRLDSRVGAKGTSYEDLAGAGLCLYLHDPFGHGKAVYRLGTTFLSDSDWEYDDGAYNLVLAFDGDMSNVFPEVASLLPFIATDESDGTDELVAELDCAVNAVLADEEWVVNVDMVHLEIEQAKRCAAAEGLAEGVSATLERQAALAVAMEEHGADASEIIAGAGTVTELYERYGV